MDTTISITRKWQIHIPKSLRRVLGEERPGQLKIRAEKGSLVITPYKSKIHSLAGSLNNYYRKKPVDIDNIRDEIDYSIA